MTQPCRDDVRDGVPQPCADRFNEINSRLGRIEGRLPADLPERLGSMETALTDLHSRQQALSRRAWEWLKAGVLFLGGMLTGKLK